MHFCSRRSLLTFLGAAASLTAGCQHDDSAAASARPKPPLHTMAEVCDGSAGPRLVAQSYSAMPYPQYDGLAPGIVVDGHCTAWAFNGERFSSGPLFAVQQARIQSVLLMDQWATKGGGRWAGGYVDGSVTYVAVPGFQFEVGPGEQTPADVGAPVDFDQAVMKLADDLAQALPAVTDGPLRVTVTSLAGDDSGADKTIAWPGKDTLEEHLGSHFLRGDDAAPFRALLKPGTQYFAANITEENAKYVLAVRPAIPLEPEEGANSRGILTFFGVKP